MGTIINIFTDGASRGNPGDAGIGIVIYDGKTILEQIDAYLGKKTNNEAEYMAVINALEMIKFLVDKKSIQNIEKINLFSDSQFLVKQLKGEFKVKSEKIIPLYNKVQELLNQLKFNFNFIWIPREENKIADSLANKGIDEKNSKYELKNLNHNLVTKSNKQKTLENYKQENSLILERAFFGKINCFKLQMNSNKEVYFHIGITSNSAENWRWIKVKMNDIELGTISNLLDKENDKCSFFHKFADSTTQIWCNKSNDSFTIKIKDISKKFTIGELQVFKILLNECIIKQNFLD